MIVKVCGMRLAENIREVEAAGADWLGLIFFPRSPRFVTDKPAYLPSKAKRVGVFVNACENEIMEKAKTFGLNLVQLHGQEPPELCERLHAEGLEVIKVFSLKSVHDLQSVSAYEGKADFFLFDTPCLEFGGSGKVFDWTLLQSYSGSTPFLLSGGLRPESLDALLAFSHPRWVGIDLNSGFELAPGLKDTASLAAFIQTFKVSLHESH